MSASKKTISFLLCVALMLMSAPMLASAATEENAYGYEISKSTDIVTIGDTVTLTLRLTDYSDAKTPIRGIQIDLTNIDPDIIEVVSHTACIQDDRAASNKTSYQASKSLVRYLFVLFSGTLDTAASDLMTVTFRIKSTLIEAGSIQLPVTVKIQNTSGPVTMKSTCTIPYRPASELSAVDISWGAMAFDYQDGAWNPATHSYKEGSWTCKADADKIRLTNKTAKTVSAELSYSVAEGFDMLQPKFMDTNQNEVHRVELTPSGGSNDTQTITVLLSGIPQKEMNNQTIGSITIELGEVE